MTEEAIEREYQCLVEMYWGYLSKMKEKKGTETGRKIAAFHSLLHEVEQDTCRHVYLDDDGSVFVSNKALERLMHDEGVPARAILCARAGLNKTTH